MTRLIALAAVILIALLNQAHADCSYDNNGRISCLGNTIERGETGSSGEARIVAHPAGCPRRLFCGCGVSVKVFGKPVRNRFLAANWFRFPRARPAPGMVAVRRHHVMYIMAVDQNGNALVYDPNSGGHKTRIHTRSLTGYTVVNPNG